MNFYFEIINFSHLDNKSDKPNSMAKEKIPEIKKNYDLYNQLLRERKSIFKEVISIQETGNNKHVLEEVIDLKHFSYNGNTCLIVNVKINKSNFYQFKLRCKDAFPMPFFRFDSDGDTHRNYIDGLSVEEQQITTPHFHYYNEEGVNIAYKTEPLLDETQKTALEDITLCLQHFFQESNITSDINDTIEVKIQPEQFPFDTINPNPHANTIFP